MVVTSGHDSSVTAPADRGAVFDDMTKSARAIVTDVLLHGPLARAELARRLSMSPASLTKLTRSLIEHGLLTQSGAAVSSDNGRPLQPLEVVPGWQHVIGVKLNPEDLFAVRTDLRARAVGHHEAGLRAREVQAVVSGIAEAVERLDPGSEVQRLGVSLAANIRPGDGKVNEAPYFGWSQVPLADLISARTGRSVVLSNDVRAFTTAQHWFGSGKHSDCFAVLTVGKGIGCGLVVNGAVAAGVDGHAGLVSHFPIQEAGPMCRRGHRGCASAYLSSGAIARSLAATEDFTWTSLDAALDAARSGSRPAIRVFTEACFALGVLTAHLVNLIGPDRVILSGEAIGLYDIAPDAVSAGIERDLHWDAPLFELEVRPFPFGEWARGAAAVAIQSLIHPTAYRLGR